MYDDQVANDLERAVDVLDERGWCQHKSHDDQDRVCLYGSLRVAIEGDVDWQNFGFEQTYEAANAINDYLGEPAADWNDVPGRTVHEVQDALRHTAKAIRNGEL